MTAQESMVKFLSSLGCSNHLKGRYVLDGFDGEFFLMFDTTDDPDQPDNAGTCDIYVCKTGSHIADSNDRMRVLFDCRRHHVMRFLYALGVDRFSEKTRKFLNDANHPIFPA